MSLHKQSIELVIFPITDDRSRIDIIPTIVFSEECLKLVSLLNSQS